MKVLNFVLYRCGYHESAFLWCGRSSHYKKLDNGFITYVGKEKKNPFLNNAWNMPNQFITYVWEGNDKNLWENLKKFNEESIQSCELDLILILVKL